MRRSLPALLIAAFSGTLIVPTSVAGAHGSAAAGQEQLAFQIDLANVPSQTLTSIVVSYPPGGKSPAHRHAGAVYAYILSGAIRSENSATGSVKIYQAGDSFFEPPGSTHLISENASASEPARLLAVFVADKGAVLTSPAD